MLKLLREESANNSNHLNERKIPWRHLRTQGRKKFRVGSKVEAETPLTEADMEGTTIHTLEIIDIKLFSFYSFPLNMLITCQLPIHSDGEACYPKPIPYYIFYFFFFPSSFLSSSSLKSFRNIELLWSKVTCEGHPFYTHTPPPRHTHPCSKQA